MNNILLTRIDNRLVHGQVAVTWSNTLGANLIVVANDEVSESKLEQRLMKIVAASQDIDIRFFSIDRTAKIIDKASPEQKIFLICKTPRDVRRLIDKGVKLDKVNIGNMHQSEDKRQLSKKVFVDDKDVEDLDYLKNKGIDLFIQDIPGDKKIQYK